MKNAIVGSLLSLGLFLSLGCQNTAEGMREDAEINRQKAAQATEKAGAEMKETGADVSAAMTLTPAIKAELGKDPSLKPHVDQIDVDSTEEQVTLNGTVPTDAAKARAQEIAVAVLKDKSAKQKLINNLEVKP